MACRVKIITDDSGKVLEVSDNHCKQGKKYAVQELISPMRVLTATVRTECSSRPLLPVRTETPIPKALLRECMGFISGIRVEPGIRLGDVVISDILGTGVNVICCDDLQK